MNRLHYSNVAPTYRAMHTWLGAGFQICGNRPEALFDARFGADTAGDMCEPRTFDMAPLVVARVRE